MCVECGLVGESALATVEFMGCMPGKGTSHQEKDIGKTREHREGLHLHRASSAFGYSLYVPQWFVGGVTCGCRNQRKTVCIGAFNSSVSPIMTKLDGTHVIHVHVKRRRAGALRNGELFRREIGGEGFPGRSQSCLPATLQPIFCMISRRLRSTRLI